MTAEELATKLTAQAEGFRAQVYDDNGHPAIGYGEDLTDEQEIAYFKEAGISEFTAMERLQVRIAAVSAELKKRLWYWNDLSTVRQAVLIDMAYQLGVPGLMAFRIMLGYLAQGHYILAAAEGLRSQWAAETPKRADHRMAMLEDGKLLPYDGVPIAA